MLQLPSKCYNVFHSREEVLVIYDNDKVARAGFLKQSSSNGMVFRQHRMIILKILANVEANIAILCLKLPRNSLDFKLRNQAPKHLKL